MKKPTRNLSANKKAATVAPLFIHTVSEVTADYVAAQLTSKKTKEFGQNCSLHDLQKVADRLFDLYQNHTFSFETFANLASSFDVNVSDLENFWIGWVRAQRGAGKIRQIESCYDGVLLAFN